MLDSEGTNEDGASGFVIPYSSKAIATWGSVDTIVAVTAIWILRESPSGDKSGWGCVAGLTPPTSMS
jgi:hypothetical protein